MSDALSTNPRADANGAGGRVALRHATIAAAWQVQADPARSTVVADVEKRFGIVLPCAAGATSGTSALTAFALGPRAWLLVEAAPDDVPAMLIDFDAARDALNAGSTALFDVSTARVAYTLHGHTAGDVLARGCPLDFDSRAFPPQTCAQSVFGQVPALFYRHRRAPAFSVLVARSYAAGVQDALRVAAASAGCDSLAAAPFDAG